MTRPVEPAVAANQRNGKTVVREYDMAIFDRLSPRMRAWLRDLPYDVAANDARCLTHFYEKQHGREKAMVFLAKRFDRLMAKQVLEVWGPEHPALKQMGRRGVGAGSGRSRTRPELRS